MSKVGRLNEVWPVDCFERQVGLTPKRFARIQRFRTLLERVALQAPQDWALTAAESGYTDQSHLSREFKRYSGATPAAFARAARQGRQAAGDDFVAFVQAPRGD